MRPATRAATALGLGLALIASLGACQTGGGEGSADGTVTITVADQPPADEVEARELFDKTVADFEAANPDIKLETEDSKYDATTFQALVAAGNLPDVLRIPFTDIQGLIANGQVANLTEALAETGLDAKLNPDTLSIAQDSSGEVFAVPIDAYSLGLVFNPSLLEAAGLDPLDPPATWEEVRSAAKAITDATGVPGFSQMAMNNAGGWMFSAMTYSFGGTIENEDGTAVTFNDEPSKQALQLLHDMRWVDHSVPEALFDYDGINQAFGTEQLGMFVGGADMYWASVINNKMDKTHYAFGPMPQNGGVNGALTGGAVVIVNPEASDAEKIAATKWIEYRYLRQFQDEEAAIAEAQAGAEAETPVGLPRLSVLSQSTLDEYNGWIAEYVNVPVENFGPYLAMTGEIPMIPEPKVKAQEVYAALDAVVQAVLTDENADIDALLADAEEALNAKLSR